MFVVTQCPPSLNNVNFMNNHWILTPNSILEVFDILYHTPRASGAVVRIETVMAEAWIEVAGRASEAHYLTPGDHDSIHIASKDLFAYEFLKSLRSFHVGHIADPEDRKVVIVHLGNRDGKPRSRQQTKRRAATGCMYSGGMKSLVTGRERGGEPTQYVDRHPRTALTFDGAVLVVSSAITLGLRGTCHTMANQGHPVKGSATDGCYLSFIWLANEAWG